MAMDNRSKYIIETSELVKVGNKQSKFGVDYLLFQLFERGFLLNFLLLTVEKIVAEFLCENVSRLSIISRALLKSIDFEIFISPTK